MERKQLMAQLALAVSGLSMLYDEDEAVLLNEAVSRLVHAAALSNGLNEVELMYDLLAIHGEVLA